MSKETVNYTAADVAAIMAAVPFNLEGAKALAADLGRGAEGYRSIIAKVKSLENDETIEGDRPFYLAKPAYVTKQGANVEKKADIVAMISAVLGGVACESLAKASKADLVRVRDALVALSPEAETISESSE